jgi:hypothetical protein
VGQRKGGGRSGRREGGGQGVALLASSRGERWALTGREPAAQAGAQADAYVCAWRPWPGLWHSLACAPAHLLVANEDAAQLAARHVHLLVHRPVLAAGLAHGGGDALSHAHHILRGRRGGGEAERGGLA